MRLSDKLPINTYKVELTFEDNWTKKRIKLTQKRNEELTEYLKARIILYGDSLNWKMPKTDKPVYSGKSNKIYVFSKKLESIR